MGNRADNHRPHSVRHRAGEPPASTAPRTETPNADRPRLASQVGRYREAPPAAALRRHFRCVWTHSAPDPTTPAPITVVPDGCVDLLWRDRRFVVVGPDACATHTALTPATTVVGLRFHPGAARAWLDIPVSEILGREVPMTEFWGQRADRIADILGAATDTAEQLRRFQTLLTDVAATRRAPPAQATSMFEFLGDAGGEHGKIALLRDRVNMSERTLRRWSHEHFGYGPKMLERVLRFQRFRALALARPQAGLVWLALEAGYSDQAHLGREIQDLCGLTAGEFVRQVRGQLAVLFKNREQAGLKLE